MHAIVCLLIPRRHNFTNQNSSKSAMSNYPNLFLAHHIWRLQSSRDTTHEAWRWQTSRRSGRVEVAGINLCVALPTDSASVSMASRDPWSSQPASNILFSLGLCIQVHLVVKFGGLLASNTIVLGPRSRLSLRSPVSCNIEMAAQQLNIGNHYHLQRAWKHIFLCLYCSWDVFCVLTLQLIHIPFSSDSGKSCSSKVSWSCRWCDSSPSKECRSMTAHYI